MAPPRASVGGQGLAEAGPGRRRGGTAPASPRAWAKARASGGRGPWQRREGRGRGAGRMSPWVGVGRALTGCVSVAWACHSPSLGLLAFTGQRTCYGHFRTHRALKRPKCQVVRDTCKAELVGGNSPTLIILLTHSLIQE